MPKILNPDNQNKVERVMSIMRKSRDEFNDASGKDCFYSTVARYMSPSVSVHRGWGLLCRY